MKNFILNQFMKLEDKIIDLNMLENYIDFCLENSTIYEKSKTANHHILPEAKKLPFIQYKDFKENPWNMSILTNYNHYYAHYLLAKSINHISISHAFCSMHMKDVKLSRLEEKDLIPENEFSVLYENRNKLLSSYLKEKILINDTEMSRGSYFASLKIPSKELIKKRSKRMLGKNNIVHLEGVVDKIRHTKITKGLDKISAERAANTMSKEYMDEDGNITTIYKKSAKKISKTVTDEYMDEDGNITTIAKARRKKAKKVLLETSKWFIVKNIFDDNLNMELPAMMVRNISPGLDTKTKDNYLGKSKFGKSHFTKVGKTHLIGLYCEELPEVPQSYNLDQDYSPYL